MEVQPMAHIRPHWPPTPPRPDLPAQRGVPADPGAPAPRVTPPEAERPEPASPPRLEVHLDRRDDGVQILTIYDPRTGDVLGQLPHEQVVKVIDAALRQLSRKDGPGDGHR
jgi:hypothetical protein